MGQSQTTVGLVQIGEVIWERRPTTLFHLVDGSLRAKPSSAASQPASLAYLPHTAGLLQAYATRYASDPGSLTFLLPLYKRLPLDEAVEHLLEADVAGFSIYVWNVRYSLAVARELKRRKPGVVIVVGGPQVPSDAEPFLRQHPFIDVACHGEGERTFLEVLERCATRSWDGVASTSFLDADGRFVANPRRDRMLELDQIPSPMLEDTYDELMRSQPDQSWLATWETNRGCPFTCTFCDWGSATASKVSRYGDERLAREIDWLAGHGIHHLFVCDANFGMLVRDVEIARQLAKTYADHGTYLAVSVQNTKNRTDRSEQIQRIFKESRAVTFGASISLQSVDRDVLKAIKRDNISLEAFDRLQKHYAREGLDTYSDLIVGLPGESYDSFANGVANVIRNGQLNRVAFYECSVLPNAPMARPEYRATYELETVPIRIIHAHEPLAHTDAGEPEFIDIVVSSSTMTREAWVRARMFAYLAEFLLYNRVLHVPLAVLGAAANLDYRATFEAFLDADPSEFPVTAGMRDVLERHTRALQRGEPQYVASTEFLDLWWPPDQYALIQLAQGESLNAFYDEARAILKRCVANAGTVLDPVLIDDLVRLNQAMFALPFLLVDDVVETSYPVASAYEAVLSGQPPDLRPLPSATRVERTETIWMSWTDWCEDLVRRVFLRKHYLYPIRAVSAVGDRAPVLTA
jgi:radical SAM superfamily enzyme YgiQ (UPF0313 family)